MSAPGCEPSTRRADRDRDQPGRHPRRRDQHDGDAVVETRDRNTYVAYFTNTNGVYTGDEIRILGVRVGTVEQIDPQPNAAKVTFTVDSQYPVPADVRAAILSPSLVTARAIQLVPAYSGGPKFADGGIIPAGPHRGSRRVGRSAQAVGEAYRFSAARHPWRNQPGGRIHQHRGS